MRAAILLFTAAAFAAEIKPIIPDKGAKAGGPYSPGILAGDFLYVAGRGASGAGGPTMEGQARACLDNVKAIVEAAGLKMDQVVYAHLYLADIANYEAVNKVWPEYFATPPARATVSVARIPGNDSIEVNVVAYKGAKRPLMLPGVRTPVPISQGMFAGDRLYIAGILGRDSNTGEVPKTPEGQVDMVFDRLSRVLEGAKLTPKHVAFANVYHTAAVPAELVRKAVARYWPSAPPAMAMVEVPSLPLGANVSITGVAALRIEDRKRNGSCTAIGSTWYCSLSELSELPGEGTVVATTVYIDDLGGFGEMNTAYANVFEGKTLPARTTVQPLKPARRPLRISFVSIR